MVGLQSFRARVLALVLAVALPPLVLVGIWLTRNAQGIAERALRERLQDAATVAAGRVVHAWADMRFTLLEIAESRIVQQAVSSGSSIDLPAAVPSAVHTGVRRIAIRGNDGELLWQTDATADPHALRVDLPIFERVTGRRIGTLEADVFVEALLTSREDGALPTGVTIAAIDPRTGALLNGVPFDPMLADAGRFDWGEERWLALTRPVAEPRVDLLVAAPHSPYLAAMQRGARQGVALLLLLGAGGVLLAWVLTRRVTQALARLADASTAVAAGRFEQRVPLAGGAELSRVASAFNHMSDNLNRTLRDLSEREALAAVGEFSAELAHEVRNPLTAIQLDLHYVSERLPDDSPLRDVQANALAEIRRLDATVSGTLLLSRRGTFEIESVCVAEPVQAAARNAAEAFARKGVRLEVSVPVEAFVDGDGTALERLFLNLLLNAADAARPGGRASVDVRVDGSRVIVDVIDDGSGIDPAAREQIFEPRFTTKRDGTGLGLTIARRIAHAHGGNIELGTDRGGGACLRVVLPRSSAAARADGVTV